MSRDLRDDPVLCRGMALRLAGRTLPLDGPPHVMGIVNVTPDSFYDRGATADPGMAIARGVALHEAGAGVLDVGGMTAQPGAMVPAEEEIARVVPVIAELRARTSAVISVDTFRADVADAAIEAGAHLVNDHTGLTDSRLASVCASHGAGLVVTHLGLDPKQVQSARYEITVEQIAEFLVGRAAAARAAGVSADSILVDPGLGFGKTTDSDLATLRRLPELCDLGYPVLLACSHKEVTAEPLGLPESTIEGTAAVVALAAHAGVAMLRLHDLPFMARVSRMGWLLRG